MAKTTPAKKVNVTLPKEPEIKNALVKVIDGNIVEAETDKVVLSKERLHEVLGDKSLVLQGEDNRLAVGVAIPSNMLTPRDYLHNLDEWTIVNQEVVQQMEVCDKMYRFDGVVGSVIDMMVDLANTKVRVNGLENEDANGVLRVFFKRLNKEVQTNSTGLKPFIEQGMTQWLVFGNAFPYESWTKVKDRDKTYKFPHITYLNPLNIDITEDKVATGQEEIFYTANKVKRNNSTVAPVLRSLLVDDTRGRNRGKRVPLSSDRVKHLKRKSRDWEAWGIPYLTRVFSPVSSKKRLRRLDDATTEGLINYLTIFRIGAADPKSPYHQVSGERIKAFTALISNPSPSTTLVWPHDVDVITAGPNGEVLDFAEKYKEVDADILKSLGIGAGIFDGGSTSEEAVLMFLETLESMREHVVAYLQYICEKVLEENGVDYDEFVITFSQIKLSDILQKLKSLVLSYYDRGLLSYETAITLGGHDFAQELENKIDEQQYREDGLFEIPNLPFSATKEELNAPNTRDDGRPSEKVQTEKPEVDNEVKEAARRRAISESFVEQYYLAMARIFTTITDDVKSNIGGRGFSAAALSTIVKARMGQIKLLSQSSLTSFFDPDKIGLVDDLFFQKVIAWNEVHLDKLQFDVINSMGAILKETDNEELLMFALSNIVEARVERLKGFAEQGNIKARVATLLSQASKRGIPGGYWRCSSEGATAKACEARDGNWYTLEQISDYYPTHPNCKCNIEWTDTNPLLEGESNKTVVSVPNKPDKVL